MDARAARPDAATLFARLGVFAGPVPRADRGRLRERRRQRRRAGRVGDLLDVSRIRRIEGGPGPIRSGMPPPVRAAAVERMASQNAAALRRGYAETLCCMASRGRWHTL